MPWMVGRHSWELTMVPSFSALTVSLLLAASALISDIRRSAKVMKDGVIYDPTELWFELGIAPPVTKRAELRSFRPDHRSQTILAASENVEGHFAR
jgi:hypothetical protein